MKNKSRTGNSYFADNKSTLFVMFVFVFALNLKGQNQTDLGHYMFFQPIINPAAAGSYEAFANAMYFRKQWVSVDGAPTKFGAYALLPVKNNSFSGSFTQESIGVHFRQRLMSVYTYRIKVADKKFLSFGIGGGVQFLESKFNDVVAHEKQDNEFINTGSFVSPDFNFGLYYFSKKYYMGFSIPGFVHNEFISDNGSLSGKTDYQIKYWNYYFHTGFLFLFSEKVEGNASTLVRIATNVPIDVDYNLQFLFRETIGIGFSFRTTKEALVFLNTRISKSIMFGYSYHIYFEVGRQQLSGHEVIMSFNLKKPNSVIIQTPRF